MNQSEIMESMILYFLRQGFVEQYSSWMRDSQLVKKHGLNWEKTAKLVNLSKFILDIGLTANIIGTFATKPTS